MEAGRGVEGREEGRLEGCGSKVEVWKRFTGMDGARERERELDRSG